MKMYTHNMDDTAYISSVRCSHKLCSLLVVRHAGNFQRNRPMQVCTHCHCCMYCYTLL